MFRFKGWVWCLFLTFSHCHSLSFLRWIIHYRHFKEKGLLDKWCLHCLHSAASCSCREEMHHPETLPLIQQVVPGSYSDRFLCLAQRFLTGQQDKRDHGLKTASDANLLVQQLLSQAFKRWRQQHRNHSQGSHRQCKCCSSKVAF